MAADTLTSVFLKIRLNRFEGVRVMTIDLTGIFDFDVQIEYFADTDQLAVSTTNPAIVDEVKALGDQPGISVSEYDALNLFWVKVATSTIALQLSERIALHFETQGFKVQRVVKDLKENRTVQSFILG